MVINVNQMFEVLCSMSEYVLLTHRQVLYAKHLHEVWVRFLLYIHLHYTAVAFVQDTVAFFNFVSILCCCYWH
jgi:hypothetical protein